MKNNRKTHVGRSVTSEFVPNPVSVTEDPLPIDPPQVTIDANRRARLDDMRTEYKTFASTIARSRREADIQSMLIRAEAEATIDSMVSSRANARAAYSRGIARELREELGCDP